MSAPVAGLSIRPALQADAIPFAQLIADLGTAFLTPGEESEAESFWNSVSADAERRYIASPDFELHTACIGEEIVGFIGIHKGRHLFHLFVDRRHQGKGIGRALWQYHLERMAPELLPETFTVNASMAAVGFYKRLGFTRTAETQYRHGISFVPMALVHKG